MKKIIACNWKQDYNHSQLTRLSHEHPSQCSLSVAVPFVHIQTARNILPNYIGIGAQNCSKYDDGPYTGEVGCSMLKQVNCDFVIIGHSERRLYFNENDDDIRAKIDQAKKNDLDVILCVGENLEQRENNTEQEVVDQQLKVLDSYENIVVAYEPVWAIGTGKVPKNKDIDDMLMFIRKSKYGASISSVIYGGSVSAKNIVELNMIDTCDGYLIGGASLKEGIFKILKMCCQEQ